MAHKLVSKTAKVLSETKKSKDKEAVAIAYEHIPRNPEEQNHGSLYAVIELEDTSGHAEEIAEHILDTLHNEYYDDPNREPLASFEAALAKINEELAERSGEGQINWLGKLNAVLGVLSGSTLHLTQAGKAEAYLYRGDHSMHITEDLTGDAVNPLRTFINVASGDLAENDKIAFVTPGVFYKLSKSELKNYVTENAPIGAVENLSKILSNTEIGSVLPNAVLVMEMVSPEAFAAEPEPEIPTEAWIKEERKPLEEVGSSTIHGAAKAFDILGKAASGASTFITTKAFPAIKSGAVKASAKIKGFSKEKSAESVILSSEEKISGGSNYQNQEVEYDHVLEPTEDEAGYEREIRIKEDRGPKLLSMERFDFSFLKNISGNVGKVGKKILPKGRYSWLYLAGGIVLVVALFAYLTVSTNLKNSKASAENILSQARSKYDTAITEIGAGDRSQAIDDLNGAEKLAENAKVNKLTKTQAEKLLLDIATAKEQALGVVKNTANLFVDPAKGELDGFYSNGKLFYAVNFSNGSVYSIDPKTKTVATIVENPTLDGRIKFGTLVVKRSTLVVYTEAKSLYEIDLVAKKATKQSVSGGLEDAVAMASYNTNIYLLSPSAGQIYKHIKITGGYGAKSAYVQGSNSGLSDAVDLSIDSDIYTTAATDNVQKFTSGQKQTYSISGFPTTPTGIKGIYVDANVKGLYLFSADMVTKIDANATFSSNYKSDSVKSISGLVVDDATNTIFALSEGKIYKINF